MARDFNENRNVNAVLGQATIDKYGNTFAVQFGLDGINIANVTVQPAPNSIIPYLEGDNTITKYAVPINVDKLCDYALASFPNIEELTLFSLTMVTFDETNLLDYLPSLTTVYVPQSLLSAYQSAYPNITFDEIAVDYTYVIEDYTQDHVLTSEIVTEQLNALTSQQRNAITKLVISSSYTSSSTESVAWGYTFGTLLPYLNNNVWYNSVKYDFTIRELSGVDELLESDITNLINGISSDKINGVTQLKFSGFSDMSVALEYDYSALPNLEYLWLNNVRYDVDELVYILPNGYKAVQYIESSGTQYIDSGIYASNKVKLEIELQYTDTTDIAQFNGYTAGASLGAFKIGYNKWTSDANYLKSWVTDANTFVSTGVQIDTNKHKWSIENGKQIFDDVEYGNQTMTFTSDRPIAIFATSDNYTPDSFVSSFSKQKLYSCKLYENNVLVRNFIPCYKNNNVGLYDLVNDVFYANQGSGTFVKGNDVINPTYFYPISDLVSEYDSNKEQTWYLDYNGTLPSYPNYQLTYYIDINCTTSILPENMQSGTRYYVKCSGTIGLDFANDSWSNIKLALNNGIAQYNLGDTKTITYNNATYTIRICDIGTRYDITNGNGTKNHITCEFVEIIEVTTMNSSNTNAGGWALCEMKTTYLPNVYNNLPSDLKAVIEQVEVSSTIGNGSTDISTSSNYLFLPNDYEIGGTQGYGYVEEQTTQYGLYLANNNSTFRKKYLSGTARDWWFRNPRADHSLSFDGINYSGNQDTFNAKNEPCGVAPFFCL